MTTPNRLEAIEARLASAKNADRDYDPRLYGDRGDSAPADLAWAVARIRELDAAIVDAAFHLEAHAKGYCELTKRDASIILASLRKAKNLKGDE